MKLSSEHLSVNDSIGMITDVQRFSVHDGPGIRTTVFMKGCSLSCAWCHNPETISNKPQIMYDQQRCICCNNCASACPNMAIELAGNSGIHINRSICAGCGCCAQTCYQDALKLVGKRIGAEELISILVKDKVLYGNDGGITFSGGEPLLQADFVAYVAKELHHIGISTAIDTAGYVPLGAIQTVEANVDLFLYDIKLLVSENCMKYIGQEPNLIIENLKYLDRLGKRIIIRHPVIADINDGTDEKRLFLELLSSLSHVESVDILMYHSYGMGKAEDIGSSQVRFQSPKYQFIEQEAIKIQRLGIKATIHR